MKVLRQEKSGFHPLEIDPYKDSWSFNISIEQLVERIVIAEFGGSLQRLFDFSGQYLYFPGVDLTVMPYDSNFVHEVDGGVGGEIKFRIMRKNIVLECCLELIQTFLSASPSVFIRYFGGMVRPDNGRMDDSTAKMMLNDVCRRMCSA